MLYLPPANEVWGKVIFLHLFVILFTGGACVVAPGGGVRGCSGGEEGMHGCSWGACIIAQGVHGKRGACVAKGVHGKGGMCGKGGACMAKGGHAWYAPPPEIRPVIARAVRIPLECILVQMVGHRCHCIMPIYISTACLKSYTSICSLSFDDFCPPTVNIYWNIPNIHANHEKTQKTSMGKYIRNRGRKANIISNTSHAFPCENLWAFCLAEWFNFQPETL